jgi:hypothetical protein
VRCHDHPAAGAAEALQAAAAARGVLTEGRADLVQLGQGRLAVGAGLANGDCAHGGVVDRAGELGLYSGEQNA